MAQVELLNELKQEGRQLEIDILKEEVSGVSLLMGFSSVGDVT